MNDIITSKPNGQARPAIYYQPAHDSQQENPDAATDTRIYYQAVSHTQEYMCCGEVNNKDSKYEDEYSRRYRVNIDIETCTATQLQEYFPGAYTSWRNLKRRCKTDDYELHPAFEKFPDFLLAVGPRPAPGYTIDRTHNDSLYSPSTCRWASKSQQTANRGITRYVVDDDGNRYTIAEASRVTGLAQSTIRQRLQRGISDHAAIHTPARGFPRQSPPHVKPGDTQRFISIWRAALKDTHDQAFFSPGGKEAGMLQQIIERFADGGINPDQALEYILTHWTDFTRYAKYKYAAWQEPPEIPTVNYLMQHIQAAGNCYLDSLKPKVKESAPLKYKWPLPGSIDV